MKTDYTIYRTDGTQEQGTIDWPEDPGFDRIDAVVAPIINVVRGHWEHVSVLHNDEPHDMFIDETGQLKGLPLNVAATAIYRNYSIKKRGADAEDLPTIVGAAVLFHRRIWF